MDAITVLSRGIAELGIYPAVDPLDSTSRILDPNIVGEEHYLVARSIQKTLQVKIKNRNFDDIKLIYTYTYIFVYFRIISHYKILLPFWVWMNCQMMTN